VIRLTVRREHHHGGSPDMVTKVFSSSEEAARWLTEDSKFTEPETRLAIWEKIHD
jgi:hypothetical protein